MFNKFMAIISFIWIIVLLSSFIYSQDIYNSKHIDNFLQSQSICLERKSNNKIQFIDSNINERNLDFYNESINNIKYELFENYCVFYIFSSYDKAESFEKIIGKTKRNNIFKEKNIIFYSNNVDLVGKYFESLRRWEEDDRNGK